MSSKKRKLMQSIFSLDSKWLRASATIFDLIVLNLLFVLSCLPVVTIGIAKMALYASLRDYRQGEVGSVVGVYGSYLRRFAKKGLQLGILEVLLTSFILVDLYLVQAQESFFFQLFKISCIAILFVAIMVFLYAYPLAMRYDLPLMSLFQRSFILLSLFFPFSFAFLAVMLLVVFLLQLSSLSLLGGLSLLAIIGISSLTYPYVVIMENLLQKVQLY
ncbi:TPA: YesL family protein [Streptococcus equi subsp. zooepidemicus]|nr:YesL family protein [Streptococcus equi subsp. zooepidemicus]HEL0040354.1 YesL family protein [Streptococcus equi subsp. zooepidemicus]HEL0042336.1 YesL family protein [Streptococcus equi subsp. zooepidemicus]HEL0044335.1 YesL family protein [Streptococcus equi subsp. zooepidemicus]HEL0052334.1 YesL family protein [Streptococcus equi subsp. zooepidemicus]